MAILSSSDSTGRLRGKIGGMVYSLQPDGTTTVREVGQQRAPSTEGEKKGQQRMKLARPYVHWVLSEPVLSALWPWRSAWG
jgi:hypothetical protein